MFLPANDLGCFDLWLNIVVESTPQVKKSSHLLE